MVSQRVFSILVASMASAVLAACGSSATPGYTSASAPVSAPASASPLATPSPSTALASVVPIAPTGEVTCDDFDVASANLRTYVHYASLNVGTANDTAPTYGEMATALGVLAKGAQACAPDATDEIDGLTVAIQSAAAAYRPGDDPAAIAAQKAALTKVKDAGVVAWTAMGKEPAEWDTTLRFTE